MSPAAIIEEARTSPGGFGNPLENPGVLTLEARRRLAECPDNYRRILERSYRAKSSPRGAIKAFCLQCTGYVRADVRDCTATACPLWPYRPYQRGDEIDEGQE